MNNVRNIIIVTIGNISTVISGVVVSFVLPKIFSLEDYGLYKTFTLYSTYLSLCHLGLIDGIVLKYGGYDFDQLPRKNFAGFFRWLLLINCFFSSLIIGISFFVNDSNFRFILILLSIYMLALNVTSYFQQISQITRRFAEFSRRKLLQSAFNIVVVALLFIVFLKGRAVSYKTYTILLVSFNIFLTIWYIFTYRNITFFKEKNEDEFNRVIELIKIGFPVLISNMCSTLVLTFDRQFVNMLFEKKTYAVYAFAYNMLSLVTVATSAIGSVIYPTLKRAKENEIPDLYSKLNSILLMFVFLMLSSFFPLCLFIKWLLPKYIDSLPIFRIVFPGLAFSSSVTVVMQNYYKLYLKNKRFFVNGVFALLTSVLSNILMYLIFGSTASISWASIATMILWYILNDRYISKTIGKLSNTNLVYAISASALFYLTSVYDSLFGMLIYIVGMLILTLVVFKKTTIRKMIDTFERR